MIDGHMCGYESISRTNDKEIAFLSLTLLSFPFLSFLVRNLTKFKQEG